MELRCNCPNPDLCTKLNRHINGRLYEIWQGINIDPNIAHQYRTKWERDAGLSTQSKTTISSIACLLPFRDNTDRNRLLPVVIDSLTRQTYQPTEIIIVESDIVPHLKIIDYNFGTTQVTHKFISNTDNRFNKSQCFNIAAKLSKSDNIICHDCDILADHRYIECVDMILRYYDSCHLGNNAYYLNNDTTTASISSAIVINPTTSNTDRMVKDFVGGSIACKRQTYFDIGGFDEQFIGYGYEDIEFYHRLSNSSKFIRLNLLDFIHLHHKHHPDWEEHNTRNKAVWESAITIPLQDRIKMLHNKLNTDDKPTRIINRLDIIPDILLTSIFRHHTSNQDTSNIIKNAYINNIEPKTIIASLLKAKQTQSSRFDWTNISTVLPPRKALQPRKRTQNKQRSTISITTSQPKKRET